MKKVIDKCVDGAKVLEVCEYGDQLIIEGTNRVFKKEKDMKKGMTLYDLLYFPNKNRQLHT